MGRVRILALLLFFTLLAAVVTCGRGRDRYAGFSSRAMVSRARYVMGPAVTQDQARAEGNFRMALPSERWVAVNEKGKRIKKTFLSFTPLPDNRYRFHLTLPDVDVASIPIDYNGEIHTLRTLEDGSLRGTVLHPDACGLSKIWIGAIEQDPKIGPVLPVTFLDACRFGPYAYRGPVQEDWFFQPESQIAARLEEAKE